MAKRINTKSRSAKTGKYVSKSYAKKHKATTVSEAAMKLKAEKARAKLYAERREKMIKLSRPLMKFLAENFDPYAHITVTSVDAELFQSEMTSPQILDYVAD